jgi:hypothetical protein
MIIRNNTPINRGSREAAQAIAQGEGRRRAAPCAVAGAASRLPITRGALERVHFKLSPVSGLRKKSRSASPDRSGLALRDLEGGDV